MPRYRVDFLRASGDVFATHALDYDNDKAAIAGSHLINGCPSIGCCFQVWREGDLIHWHYNVPPGEPHADAASTRTSTSTYKH